MSQRSTYVSDVLFDKAQAEQIASHIAGAVETAFVLEIASGKWAVVGYVRCGAPGMEWELLAHLPLLPKAGSLVINSEGERPIWWNLETASQVIV